MAVAIGNGRYYKLFRGNSAPKRLLIGELNEPGLLSSSFIQGIVGQVFPIKNSERYGKLCKIVLREDLEKRTLRSTCATINAFLLGDLADEGDRIKEGDRVVLSEVVVECSPTDEHLYQLIAWREKSQASIWVINNKGNVRVNNASGNEKTQVNNAEDGKNLTCSADTDEEETVVQETSEPGFYIVKKTSTGEEGRRRSKPKIFEKRKGKFHLGPKGVTPSKSHVMRKVSDAVVVIDKSEVTKCLSRKDEMGGVEHLSLSIQNGSPNQPSNVQCTHTELSPAGVSTRICEGRVKAGQMRDQSQTSTVPSDLLQLKAPEVSALSIVESDVTAEGNYQINDKVNAQQKTDEAQQMSNEDMLMPDFEQEDQVFLSARRRSSSTYSVANQRSPAKGLNRRPGIPGEIPHTIATINEDETFSTSTRSLIPEDYTPVASLLADQGSNDQGGVKRSSPNPVLDVKRLRASPGPSSQLSSRDQLGSPREGERAKEKSSREAADYTVPQGYTTLANLKPETVVNIYGVVKSFKPAWKCRGTDMCSVLMITDPTVVDSTFGLECVFFQQTISRLPAVHKVGDIVRLHRIKISQYQEKLQAMSSRGFAAIVFDRDSEVPVTAEMARVSSSTFSLSKEDKDTIQCLIEWCDCNPAIFPLTNFIPVTEINPDCYFDLVGQVLGVALHRTLDCVVLFVTDGTHPKCDIREGIGDEYNVVEPPDNHRSAKDGDIISVFLYGAYAEVARLLARKGNYVILHNLHSQILKQGGSVCSVVDVVRPYVELCIHRGTCYGRGLTLLSADSPEVIGIKKRLGV
ncbi:uncharacterized protein LOC113680077 [Pocillopora damicornis]|uniref:uncharacterized protein LOC113680077 n=1 Tax=Pocillopora damicornis TaxID=46731 RepID=UPI000F554326|nr:uncharacterized protein LOC113680077 [Pocillopora damicornis]